MDKKFYIITTTVTLVISACLVLFFIFKSNLQPKEMSEKYEPVRKSEYVSLPPQEIAKKPVLEIQTEQGKVEISNVYKKSIANISNNGVAFEDNEYYYISYYPNDDSFNIVLNNSDVKVAREKAEEGLLNDLGIGKEEACKLNVILGIPYGISNELSGQNYGLSFCPNGKEF